MITLFCSTRGSWPSLPWSSCSKSVRAELERDWITTATGSTSQHSTCAGQRDVHHHRTATKACLIHQKSSYITPLTPPTVATHTWSCLSFLASAGMFRAIAMTTAAACGGGRKGRSRETSRFPFLTDMIIRHCSSLTLGGGESENELKCSAYCNKRD